MLPILTADWRSLSMKNRAALQAVRATIFGTDVNGTILASADLFDKKPGPSLSRLRCPDPGAGSLIPA